MTEFEVPGGSTDIKFCTYLNKKIIIHYESKVEQRKLVSITISPSFLKERVTENKKEVFTWLMEIYKFNF